MRFIINSDFYKKKQHKPENLKNVLQEWNSHQNAGCESEWDVC